MTADAAKIEHRLWKAIDHRKTGMLGLTRAGQHFQPMTAFAEPDAGLIWFFTRSDTDLGREIAAGDASAMFVFQEDHLQACIGGDLTLSADRTRIDRYWGPVVAAWYPEGKDDPQLTLIRMACSDAEVWVAEGGPAKFALEIAKANMTRQTPDLGGRAHLDLQ